jgi:DNA-binding transcriptional MerR regulator
MFTVGKLAQLSGVTVKTLHHYHRIGLVVPHGTSEAGYRLYDRRDLERLQQVLFYKELDFGLSEIKRALSNQSSRGETLAAQRQLLLRRRDRLSQVLATLELSLKSTIGEVEMTEREMFSNLGADEWNKALESQNQHLKEEYGYEAKVTGAKEAEVMNRAAQEAQRFLLTMAEYLRDGRSHGDEAVVATVAAHVEVLNETNATDVQSYFRTVEFLTQDPFHRNVFERTQVGLASYLFSSAYACRQRSASSAS